MMLSWKELAYLIAVTSLIRFGKCQADLQFSETNYEVTLITSVTTMPGSNVTRIGFNRPLNQDERDSLIFYGLSANLLTIDTTTLDVSVGSEPITESFSVIIGIFSGQLRIAMIIIQVIDPVNACINQAAGQCSQICALSETNEDGYTCSCLEGYSLLRDDRTCTANDPVPIILLSHGNRISEIDTSIRQSSALYEQTDNITLFDYNYADQALYFVSDTNSQIIQTSLTVSNSTITMPILSTTTNSITGIAVDWISGNVLYSDSIMGSIQQYHVTTGHVTPLVTNLRSPKVLATIPDEPYRYLFWFEKVSDTSTEYSIKRTSLNDTGNILTFNFNLVNPVAMTIDVVTEKIFWIDVNVVSSSSFDGTNKQEVYTSSSNIDSIAAFEDYIYISSASTNNIVRINKRDPTLGKLEFILSFNGIQQLHILHPLVQPPTLDDIDECLINNGGCGQGCVNTIGSYYCSCIHGYDLLQDGQTCVNTSVCSTSEAIECNHGCGLSVSDSIVCLCNPGYKLDTADNITCTDVNECLEEGTCSHGCINTDGGFKCSCPAGLFVGPDRRSCTGCSIGNGGCSQTCVTFTDSFQCQCKIGYTLGTDQTSCFPTQISTLITSTTVGSANTIIEAATNGLYLDTLVYSSNTVSGPNVPTTGDVIGMDVDVNRDYLYFGDRSNTGLFRVKLSDISDSSDGRTLIVDGVKIWGVAYDWINDYLYWTEDGTGRIRRVLVSGNEFSPELVLGNLDSPQGLVIEPFAGYIFWTEFGANPRVRRTSLTDFSSIEDLFTLAGNPTGIAIDYLSAVLIWSDLGNNSIHYSNFDGSNVVDIITTNNEQSPFQIVTIGHVLYWTSPNSTGFNRIDYFDSDSLVHLSLEGYPQASSTNGITIIDENKRSGSGYHECLVNALDCSHYCAITSNGDAICTCPVGYVLLQDEKTCDNIFSCTVSQSCDGSFANTTGTPLFFRPSVDGEQLNTPTTPIMVSGQVLESCQIQSVQYLDHSCYLETIEDNIFTVYEAGLYAINTKNLIWSNLNGRLIALTLTCTNPPVFGEFCINFEIATLASATSCGLSNGGCSDFCTNEYSLIPVCTCPIGQTLGQNGDDCISLCDPNPCLNNGTCSTDSQGSIQCLCPQSYTGPLCLTPTQLTCSNNLCNREQTAITVERTVGGDTPLFTSILPFSLSSSPLTSPQSSCIALNGYCVGSSINECNGCRCGPQDTFLFQTQKCSNEDCSYKLGQSSQKTPPLYINSNNDLVSVATGNKLSITDSATGDPINVSCAISIIEVDTGTGWVAVTSGSIGLTTEAENTYLTVASNSIMDQLRGQVIRITFSCGGCLRFSFYGSGTDLSLSDVCNSCEGYLEGFENLGLSVATRPSPTAVNPGPVSDRNIIYNGAVQTDCNSLNVTYYDNDCSAVAVPDDLIYATQNRIYGRNFVLPSWDTIVSRTINITLRCGNQVEFCLLFRLQDIQQTDSCTPNPCNNNGTCVTISDNEFYCSCPTGLTGPTCSDVDYCLEHVCLNNGTCINGAGYATCICPTNTILPYCIGPDDKNFGPCDLLPCNNGGTCVVDAMFGYICECVLGFEGVHCDIDNLCLPNPCPVNVSCSFVGSVYTCGDGGGGGTGEDNCDPNPCLNGGNCSDGNCTCVSGYTGTTCEIDVNECDPDPCLNGGTCSQPAIGQFSCNCTLGYIGTTCEIDVNECDPDPCLNGGTCSQPAIGQFSCNCTLGYTGTTCETDVNECDPDPCLNSGTCSQPAIGQFSCNCTLGYTGTTCETDVNECDPDPCLNGGTCSQPAIGQFSCNCTLGYTGTTCEIDVNECDPDPCLNGTCSEPAIGQFSCNCTLGYTGTTCETDVNECDPDPCLNGTCSEPAIGQFSCNCTLGYTGTTCETDVNECDPDPCLNGTCSEPAIGQFSCNCTLGYTGTTCETDVNECDPDPCLNGGTCSQPAIGQFSCNCTLGYTGTTCEIDVNECDPDPCLNGGTCSQPAIGQFSCNNCTLGYTGTTCEIDVNECDPNPCLNGGTCSEPAIGQFSCDCAPGYTGTTCRDDINECDVQTDLCQNGGTCENRSPGFLCRCSDGYTGLNCENECSEGTFGSDCAGVCNCLNGALCDHVTGVCICDGYTGARCETPLCSQSCNNGGTCSAPNVCICPETYTGPTCDDRECTTTFCSIDRGTCSLNIIGNLRCTCLGGFTGARCEVTISGQLGSREKGGVSGGVIGVCIVLLILTIAAVFIIWKVIIPYYRRKRNRQAMWYLDTTMVRGNPSVVDDLLDSEYVAKEFKDRGVNKPLDNPIYGYIPPNINPVRSLGESQSSQLSREDSTDSNDEWEGIQEATPFRTDIIPNAVIINRHISPDSDFGGSDPDYTDGDNNEENVLNQWKTSDTRNNGSGDMV